MREELAAQHRANALAGYYATLPEVGIREPIGIVEWAEKHRRIGQGGSPLSMHGDIAFDVSVMPWCEEPMLAARDPNVTTLSLQWASGTGKTDGVVSNVIGWAITESPRNIMALYPNEAARDKWSRDVLQRTIDSTPILRGAVIEKKGRESGNTISYKPLDVDTPIPTPKGWTTMGQLQIGDFVFDQFGYPTQIYFATHPREAECYEVEFHDGEKIVADGDHLWAVESWKVIKKPHPTQTRVPEVLTTKQIIDRGVSIGVRSRFSVRNALPLVPPTKDLPVKPYVLGAWLGDGTSHRAWITVGNHDVDEFTQNLIQEGVSVTRQEGCRRLAVLVMDRQKGSRGPDGRMFCEYSGVTKGLRELGLMGRTGVCLKRIPEAYLRASFRQRLHLLQGLMDTDGSADKMGRCVFTASRIEIADGFAELLSSMGIVYARHEVQAYNTNSGKRVDGKMAHVFQFVAPFCVFRLRRKQQRQRTMIGERAKFRRIVSVRAVGKRMVKCIAIDTPTHLFLAGRNMVPTHNCFPGGSLYATAAGSPSNLRGPRVGLAYAGEVDAMPDSVGREGDPLALLYKRCEGFADAIKIAEGTPTIKGKSRIEGLMGNTDYRKWFVPCRKCGHRFVIMFGLITWPKGKHHLAELECEKCNARHDDEQRRRISRDGMWRPTQPFVGHRGYWLNAFVTTLPAEKGYRSKMHQWAMEWHDACHSSNSPEKKRVFINTVLAETDDDDASIEPPMEWEILYKRREPYVTEKNQKIILPEPVRAITAGIDVQTNRIEFSFFGWGRDEQCWVLAHTVLMGNPAKPGIWEELESHLTRRFTHPSGVELETSFALIDRGDQTDEVDRFAARPTLAGKVYTCKGASENGVPIRGRLMKTGRGENYFRLGTNAAKEYIYGKLALEVPGDGKYDPGFIHFPQSLDPEYFKQLCAEQAHTVYERGKQFRKYKPITAKARNEALDTFVYGLAAFRIKAWDWDAITDSLSQAAKPTAPKAQPRHEEEEENFATGWRGR